MPDLSQLNSFEAIIQALEQVCPGPGKFPGTRLQRLVLTKKLAESYKLGLPADKDSNGPIRAWCLTLGRAGHPHQHIYYAWDITGCVTQAVKELLLGKATA